MPEKKEGYPEKSEIVLCTVARITANSVFVTLDEYNNLEGLIHISEIAPGRIRNIRDYVRENKKVVCMVLTSDPSRNLVDLSLRRVSLQHRLAKETLVKQEHTAKRILDSIAKGLKIDEKELHQKVGALLKERFQSLFAAFQNISAQGEKAIEGLDIDKKISKKLIAIIQEKIKKPEVTINSILIIKNPSPDGIEIIRDILKKAIEHAKKKEYKMKVHYLGSPKYKITVNAPDFKLAEKILAEITDIVTKESKETSTQFEFAREK